MTTEHAFDDVVAGYALGALDGEDRLAFEVHLATCSRCQAELAEYRRVVGALGAGVEGSPVPEALKAKTLARATGRPARAISSPIMGSRPGWTWLQAAAVLLIGVLGAYVWSLRSTVDVLSRDLAVATERAEALRQELATLRQERTQLASMVDVFGAPDVVRVDLRGANPTVSGTARAYVSLNQGLVFTAAGLPALQAGRVYQLWVIPPGAATPLSAGLVPTDSTGGARITIELPPGVTSVGTVAVTDEPGPAGSPGPTSAPLLAGTAGG
jgi:anti-sigma-K factor RskA